MPDDQHAPDEQEEARGRRWMRHEVLLSALGLLTVAGLVFRAGPADPATIQTSAACLLFMGSLWLFNRSNTSGCQKLRFASAYAFVLWFYTAIESIVPALRTRTIDAQLLAADECLFGRTPAVGMQCWSSTWVNELMSGCYLSYLVYLHVCLFHALVGPVKSTRRLAKWLFSVYAIGLAGYLLFPAVGTSKAFPELFAQPIEGPLLTPLNRMVVEQGSSVYDAFPSLHVLITCTLLEYDRRYCRRRFFAILLPALGIFTSALYLRYHYAVDLLAGGALFILAKILFKERTSIGVETGHSDKR